jgi:hypothetical protein
MAAAMVCSRIGVRQHVRIPSAEGPFPETMSAYRPQRNEGDLVVSGDDPQASTKIEFETSDPGDLVALRAWLRELPGLEAQLAARRPTPGELGGVEVLAVLASSSVLASAIKTLPDFLRSRRSGVRFEATANGDKVVVEVTNAKEATQILERLLDGRD